MKRLLFLFVSFPFFLSSCGGDSSTGPILRGDIWGYMELYDQDGRLLTDHSGVSVSLEGTEYTAVSDAEGRWALKDVPAGIYQVTFRKEGFDWTKVQEQFVGNGDLFLGTRPLGRIPTFGVSDFTVSVDSVNLRLHFSGTFSDVPPEEVSRNLSVFISTDSTSFKKTRTAHVGTMSGRTINAKGGVAVHSLHNLGYPSGSVAYLRAYPVNQNGNLLPDMQTREYYMTSCSDNGSQTVRVVIP